MMFGFHYWAIPTYKKSFLYCMASAMDYLSDLKFLYGQEKAAIVTIQLPYKTVCYAQFSVGCMIHGILAATVS